MRPIERIDNFLRLVDWDALMLYWGITDFNETIRHKTLDDVVKYWKENPDQRIGQVLINLGIVPDSIKIWNDEEQDILEVQDISPEEYLFWTSVYDKDGSLLKEPITKLVKDLDTKHINAIKDFFNTRGVLLLPNYENAFNNVLNKKQND